MEEINPLTMYGYRTIAKNGWLRVGEAGVYNLIRSGRLKATNVSAGSKYKRYAIKGSDIIQFLKDNEVRIA